MKRIGSILMLLLLVSPCLVYSDLVTFKLGYFFPRAGSDLWETEFLNMTFVKSDYTGSIFGFAYEYFVTRELALQVSVDGYTKQQSGFYNEWDGLADVDGRWAYPMGSVGVPDFFPQHVFAVSVTPIQLNVKLTPLGRANRVIPFIGAGVGLYIWSARLQGDLIDFDDVWEDTDLGVLIHPIYISDIRDDNKLSFGFQGLGGIILPLASRVSFEGEFKYNFAKGTLDRFTSFERFDLSGYQISLAFNYWF
ncbi:hypothetical protein ACFLR7_03355 [Acidobacteriota bacterium]